jgi:hypothetical protein
MDLNSRANWAKALKNGVPLAQVLATPVAPVAAPVAAATTPAPAQTKLLATSQTLPALHVGRGYRFGNLDWFPVWTDAPQGVRNYTTKASAQSVRVSELTDANVSGLQIENSGSKHVLLLEGSLLEGGWQHRALTRSVFVRAHSAQQLPVVCVEQGRWGGGHGQALGQKLAPARVRAAMRGMHKRTDGVYQASADQGKVWDEIHKYQADLHCGNATASYVAMRDQIDREMLSLEDAKALVGQRGVIVAINGQPVALELFDHSSTLSERLDAILRGFLVDAMSLPYVETPSRRARRFADRVIHIGVTEVEDNNRKRNKPDAVVAAEALFNANDLLHLSALNARHSLVLAA